MDLKSALPILQRLADDPSLPWQVRYPGGIWVDHEPNACPLDRAAGDTEIRIKPPAPAPAVYGPLGPEDIPPGSVVRKNDAVFPHSWSQIVAVTDDYVLILSSRGTSYILWIVLLRDYEILRPGGPWEPARKALVS